jgi:hypothetical protein
MRKERAVYGDFFSGFATGSFPTICENSPVLGFFFFPRILNLFVAPVITFLQSSLDVPVSVAGSLPQRICAVRFSPLEAQASADQAASYLLRLSWRMSFRTLWEAMMRLSWHACPSVLVAECAYAERGGSDMLIDRLGEYATNGYQSAHVLGLRGVNCIGYIIQPEGNKIAAVWHSADGTRIKGPVDENLSRFVGAKKPKQIRSTPVVK